jgi:predicted small lipoprotein YifL
MYPRRCALKGPLDCPRAAPAVGIAQRATEADDIDDPLIVDARQVVNDRPDNP